MNYRNMFAGVCLAAVSAQAAPFPKHPAIAPPARAMASHAAKARGAKTWPAANDTGAVGVGRRIPRDVPMAGKQELGRRDDTTWTNDRLELLVRDRGPISEFNQLPDARAAAALDVIAEQSNPFVLYDRTKDPRWYAEQASALRAKIQALELETVRYLAELQLVRNLRTMEAGLAIYQDTVGVTPEAGIDLRRMLLLDLRTQLSELRDLARRNGILPGIVRE
ncbi:MAG TPA: hypothetical protein VOA41_17125 [Candidatus Dormibacteraeota bacterium]|nr:hypothetical protein [Candidatus Dormibacteraeota bacterium]